MIKDEKELTLIVQSMLDNHPEEVKKYKAGKTKILKFFKGQIVKITNQTAHMATVDKILDKLLK